MGKRLVGFALSNRLNKENIPIQNIANPVPDKNPLAEKLKEQEQKTEKYQRLLYNSRKVTRRHEKKLSTLDKSLRENRKSLRLREDELKTARQTVSACQEEIQIQKRVLTDNWKREHEAVVNLRRQNANLSKKCSRIPDRIEIAKARAKRNDTTMFFDKNSYKPAARALARNLVSAGCARRNVGTIFTGIATLFGVSIPKMSGRTVSRCILEGGVAAGVQTGREIELVEGR
jgi:HSP90 family molecular chaperone